MHTVRGGCAKRFKVDGSPSFQSRCPQQSPRQHRDTGSTLRFTTEVWLMADNRKFQYKCSKGHDIISEKEQTKCLVVSLGSPCKGILSRVGKGSKTSTDMEK